MPIRKIYTSNVRGGRKRNRQLFECFGIALGSRTNKKKKKKKKRKISPRQCAADPIYIPDVFPEKRVHFHFRRSFAVLSPSDRSFSYPGYDDEEYPMLERESSIFFPRFFLFSIPSISFFLFFFFSSFLRLRPATLTLIRRRATIFIDNCLPLQEFCLQEFWHARDENY